MLWRCFAKPRALLKYCVVRIKCGNRAPTVGRLAKYHRTNYTPISAAEACFIDQGKRSLSLRWVFCTKSRAVGGGARAGSKKYREMTAFSREREARGFLWPRICREDWDPRQLWGCIARRCRLWEEGIPGRSAWPAMPAQQPASSDGEWGEPSAGRVRGRPGWGGRCMGTALRFERRADPGRDRGGQDKRVGSCWSGSRGFPELQTFARCRRFYMGELHFPERPDL